MAFGNNVSEIRKLKDINLNCPQVTAQCAQKEQHQLI